MLCRHCLKLAFIHLLIYFTFFLISFFFFTSHCVLSIPDAGPTMISKRFELSFPMEHKVNINGSTQTIWQTSSRVLCNIPPLTKGSIRSCVFPWWWSFFPRYFADFYIMVHKNDFAFIVISIDFFLYFFLFFFFFRATKNFYLLVVLALHELPW